jgi:hypothetical protein
VGVKAGLSRVRWGLVLAAAIVLYVVTFILGIALTVPLLALLDRANLSSDSATQVTSWLGGLLVVVVTGYGALWVARRVEGAPLLHGFLVGLVVAILSLLLDVLFRPLTPVGLVLYALMVSGGLLGGAQVSRARELA